jgi:uncharacterized protein (TIGR00290 family)
MKSFLNWSGGKDAAFCLYKSAGKAMNIEALVTTISDEQQRISMHGVRRELLERQAASLQLPLHIISLPASPGMQAYEAAISQTNLALKEEGFTHAVSGDLFLEDLKAYREGLYAKDGIQCVFPLWKMDTKELMFEFIGAGFKAIVVCVNSQSLDASFCGRLIDHEFITDLPPGVDICGENGEYHSFVFDGPVFKEPLHFTKGNIVFREYPSPSTDDCFTAPRPATGFYFADLLPLNS